VSYWDDQFHTWSVERGDCHVRVGTSSDKSAPRGNFCCCERIWMVRNMKWMKLTYWLFIITTVYREPCLLLIVEQVIVSIEHTCLNMLNWMTTSTNESKRVLYWSNWRIESHI
jgi:hypothetical protein